MSLNWGKLVAQGRAKAHGVPWTEEEWEACLSGIPAEFVRMGILDKEEYEKLKDSPDRKFKPLASLRQEAGKMGLEFADVTTRQELIEMMEVAESKAGSEAPSDTPMSEEKKEDAPESPEAPKEEAPAESPKEEAPAPAEPAPEAPAPAEEPEAAPAEEAPEEAEKPEEAPAA